MATAIQYGLIAGLGLLGGVGVYYTFPPYPSKPDTVSVAVEPRQTLAAMPDKATALPSEPFRIDAERDAFRAELRQSLLEKRIAEQRAKEDLKQRTDAQTAKGLADGLAVADLAPYTAPMRAAAKDGKYWYHTYNEKCRDLKNEPLMLEQAYTNGYAQGIAQRLGVEAALQDLERYNSNQSCVMEFTWAELMPDRQP
ncbi:MAG: hypothetical protein EON60_12325 [Alphaproteobacteria bacterium]|nr:MAG: hypothetical protein EON60_12325 [Alphaproteobacteria bacterium]